MVINTKQLYYILDNTPATQNIMLVGKHGIGKSRILEDYYTQKGAKVVTLFLGQMADPGDLIGLPEKDETTGKTDFMLPYWFPTDGKPVVLFLDELNRARPEVLQTIMDLTLNRKLTGKSLPQGSRIISAVNNGSEYQLTDLDPALVSRFNIYEFEPTVEDWLLWAEQCGLDSRIISFISENPELLDASDIPYETENLERTPDRRSWERTSQIIKNMPELTTEQMPLVSGIIGNQATAQFFRFVMEHDVPSAKTILLGDKTPEEITSQLSFANLTQTNIALFRFIEASNLSEKEKSLAAKNLRAYFESLQPELKAHFASLCSAEQYPKTLVYITENAPDLYDALMNLIMQI